MPGFDTNFPVRFDSDLKKFDSIQFTIDYSGSISGTVKAKFS